MEEVKNLRASIVESSEEAIVGEALDGKIVSWNTGAEKLYGYQAAEAIGKPVSILWPPDTPVEERRAMDRIQIGEGSHFETVRVGKDGRRIDVSLTLSPIRNGSGEAIGASAMSRDVTELRKTKAELALRNRIADIFLTVPDESVSGEVLRSLLEVTRSEEGLFGHIDEEGALVCSMIVSAGKGQGGAVGTGKFRRNEWAGALGGQSLVAKQTVQFDGGLAVPILYQGEAIGHFAVANKSTDYNQADQLLLEHIAGYLAPILQARLQRDFHERALTNALAAKLVLLQEVHHRVKNNLQTISSLLSLQAESLPEAAQNALEDSQRRVRAMALVHEQLYSQEDPGDLDFAEYAASLTTDLFYVCKVASNVRLRLDVKSSILGADQAIPCGLILNELVTNSLKYAFPDSRAGEVLVEVRSLPDGQVLLRVADNGIGLPAGFDWQHASTLGLRIVNLLTHQLKGTLRCEQGPGSDFTLVFARHRT